MKKSALLALIFALALVSQAHATGNSTPDDDCPGAHFCDPDGRDNTGPDSDWDGEREEDREPGPDDVFDEFGGNSDGGSETFLNGMIDGRIERGGYRPGRPGRPGRDICDRNRWHPDCQPGRPDRPGRPGHGGPHPGPGPGYPPPGHGPGYPPPGPGHGYPDVSVTERLIINRPVRFESLEINLMLGRMIERLRGYELTGMQVVVVDGRTYRPGSASDLALVVNGRVEDSVRVFDSGRPGYASAYSLRPYRGADMGFRGERIQLAVQGEVFIGEIQLTFRRLR